MNWPGWRWKAKSIAAWSAIRRKWQVSHGPFSESYDHLSENNWSLLVQAVNNWHEPTAALMQPFRALRLAY